MISHSMIGNSNNNLLNHNSVGSSGSKSTIYSNSTYDKEISMRAKKNNIQFMNNNNYNEKDLFTFIEEHEWNSVM